MTQQNQETVTKQKNPLRIEQGRKLVECNRRKKEELKRLNEQITKQDSINSHLNLIYTSIPHDLLKSRISNLVHNAFRKKDGSVRYTHIKLTRAKGYFTHDINGGRDNMFTAD